MAAEIKGAPAHHCARLDSIGAPRSVERGCEALSDIFAHAPVPGPTGRPVHSPDRLASPHFNVWCVSRAWDAKAGRGTRGERGKPQLYLCTDNAHPRPHNHTLENARPILTDSTVRPMEESAPEAARPTLLDVLEHVAPHLGAADLARVGRVCKSTAKLVACDYAWKGACEIDFEVVTRELSARSFSRWRDLWRELRARYKRSVASVLVGAVSYSSVDRCARASGRMSVPLCTPQLVAPDPHRPAAARPRPASWLRAAQPRAGADAAPRLPCTDPFLGPPGSAVCSIQARRAPGPHPPPVPLPDVHGRRAVPLRLLEQASFAALCLFALLSASRPHNCLQHKGAPRAPP